MSKVITNRSEKMENGRTLEQYAKMWMNEIKDDISMYCSLDYDNGETEDKQLHEVIKMMAQIWNEENNK